MVRLINLYRPGPAASPGMSGELAAHHLGSFRPFVEIIRRRVNANNTLTALDEIHQTLAQFRLLEPKPRGIIQANSVKLT